DAPRFMVNISVLADDVEVFEFPSDESEIISPQYITVEVRATIITLRNGGLYVAACEVQLEECVAGRFGSDCQQTCSVGCSDTCDMDTGRCTCRQGWDATTCTGGLFRVPLDTTITPCLESISPGTVSRVAQGAVTRVTDSLDT
ncbi:hypothetical protein BaRGS_00019105, partial [Batillaria attramentaria]